MFLKKVNSYIFYSFIFLNVAVAQQPRLVLPIGHTALINSISHSPDSRYILTSSVDHSAKIWSVPNRKLLLELIGHRKGVNTANYSPDGKYIVTSSEDSTAIIWNAADGTALKVLKGHTSELTSASFSPDGKNIITNSLDGTAKIWDAASGNLVREIKGVRSCATYSPDGKKICLTTGNNTILIYAADGKKLQELAGHSDFVTMLNFSSDNKLIVSSSWDGTVKVWNIENGKMVREIKIPAPFINYAMFSPDGKHILIDCGSGKAMICNSSDGKIISKFREADFSTYSSNGKYIVTAYNNYVKIRNAQNGKIISELKAHTYYISDAEYSPDGNHIITTSGDGTAKIWNASDGKLATQLTGHAEGVSTALYSPDEKYIVTSSFDHSAKIWNAKSGKLLTTLFGHKDGVHSATFSPDGKYIITASWDYSFRIWNVATGKIFKEYKTDSIFINMATYSPDGKFIVTALWDSIGIIWNATNGTVFKQLKGHSSFSIYSATYSSDGKYIVTASADGTAMIWNASDGSLLKKLSGHTQAVNFAAFSPDGKKIVTASDDQTIKIWDAETGSIINTLEGHKSYIHHTQFSPDGKRIISSSQDNTCKIWDVETGQLIYTFFSLDATDFFGQIPSGYYQCTSSAAKLIHYVTKDLKVIGFEQLDVKYNRPDKVLEAIGNKDTALIKSYRRAWEKRIKKLGIDTTAFRDSYSVPEADFSNRDAIEYEQKKGILSLHIKGIDSVYKLDRFNIWINEVPLYGQRGIYIRKGNKNDFDTTVTIKLSQGENRIETSITNVNGTESYRMPLIVNYSPAIKQKEMTRFIGIGIDQFADNKYNLQYSSKDIRDLSKKLKEKYKDNIIIDTLFNENITLSNIKALKQKLLQTTENDKVIIAYSGHGMLSKDYDYYLSTYTVNFANPEKNGLSYDELENLLDSIPARKKLMLIDACHSGEVDKEDLITLNATSDSLLKGLKPVAYKKDGQLGLKNSFELMQSLFVNVGKSTGATIISAAAGTQFALERNDLKNGVFTYSILEAMNKYQTLNISELKKIVGERVEQLTKGLQKPTSRNETIAVDWNVW